MRLGLMKPTLPCSCSLCVGVERQMVTQVGFADDAAMPPVENLLHRRSAAPEVVTDPASTLARVHGRGANDQV